MPAALDHLVAGVIAHVVVLVRLEEVVRRHGVAVVEQTLLLHVEGAALQEHAEQLVRVPSQGVGALHAAEATPTVLLANQETAAPSSLIMYATFPLINSSLCVAA